MSHMTQHGEPHSLPTPNSGEPFFRAGMIEAWGRGIERIMEACRTAKTPVPKLRYEPSGLWVEFALPTSEAGRLDEKLDEKLGVNRATILRLMRSDPKITVTEIAEKLGMSRTAADKNIQILKSQGYIARIGAAKGGFWKVKEANA